MKPSWDDAPRWAHWLALDGSGDWYWFAERPKWDHEGEWTPLHGEWQKAPGGIRPDESLEPRP